MKYANFPEEQLKNTLAHYLVPLYDTIRIIGNSAFCVAKWLSFNDEEREGYSIL